MVVEHSPWLSTWFEDSAYIKSPIEEFDVKTVSFTYGDSHPTFSPWPRDDDWNNDGKFGPERYIEAHIWSDETINKFNIKDIYERDEKCKLINGEKYIA